MTVSLMSFCNFISYIIISLFAGSFVDRHNKKMTLLAADTVAAACSLAVLVLNLGCVLQIWHIYVVNFVSGAMNAFQSPASSVVIGKVVPKERLAQVSGMNSFSGNAVTVVPPVLAAVLFAVGGLKIVLAIDLCSFVFAFAILIFVLRVPADLSGQTEMKFMFAGRGRFPLSEGE